MILYPEADREADMARAYGMDLRRRVVDAIEAGLSARMAADRFSVAPSTAINWHRHWRETGSLDPGRQGKPSGSKLDEHEAFILGLVEDNKDIALHEIAAKLAAERGVRTCAATLWYFFSRRGLTHKKRQAMPPSNSARTSSPGGKTGSTDSLTSTPSD
ncbi:transposase [Parvibaculum indicum]|nr:transposase [Parvibaculum indicum]